MTDACPRCDAPVAHQEGCVRCPACGWAVCADGGERKREVPDPREEFNHPHDSPKRNAVAYVARLATVRDDRPHKREIEDLVFRDVRCAGPRIGRAAAREVFGGAIPTKAEVVGDG